jgi:hypothetical protein
MAHKFEIIGQALVVTDTVTNKILLDMPKGEVYYYAEDLEALVNPKIKLYDISGMNSAGNAVQYYYDLSLAVDSLNAPFSVASFKSFARLNLGFKTALQTETDPVFGSSEASLFVSGDKAKLDNSTIKYNYPDIASFPLTGQAGIVYIDDEFSELYTWNGTEYINSTFMALGWDLNGNTGTNPLTDFLGTTDNQPLIFKTNNIEKARLLPNGNFAFGLNNTSAKFDVLVNPAFTVNNESDLGIRISRLNGATNTGQYIQIDNSDASSNRLVSKGNNKPIHIVNISGGAGTGTVSDGIRFFVPNTTIGALVEAISVQSVNGNTGIGISTPTKKLDINGELRVRTLPTGLNTENLLVVNGNGDVRSVSIFVNAPATATSTGIAGQRAYDANFFYVCVATNTWKRTALTTF